MGKLTWTGRVETIAEATPSEIWAVVSDIRRIGEWSHECRSGAWLDDAVEAKPGARFAGTNQLGRYTWSRTSEVTIADAPHVLAWRTEPSHVYRDSTEWRIELEPHERGTRIVQTYKILKINPVMERLIYLLRHPQADSSPHKTVVPVKFIEGKSIGQPGEEKPA